MGLMASSSGGGEYEQVPPGTHRAVCYKFVEIVTGKQKHRQQKISIDRSRED